MENKTIIGFIGAGNMAYAMINGLLSNGYDSKKIKVSDPNNKLLKKREAELEAEIEKGLCYAAWVDDYLQSNRTKYLD